MAAFFRGLLLFLFGAIVGAGGMLFFTPSFNVVVSRAPGARKPVEFASAPSPVVVQAPVVAKAAEPVAPSAPAVPEKTKADVAVAPVAPAAPAATEPAIDFKSISEHLILWPTTVSVKAATTVAVLVDGKKVQDLALEAGTVLQVSKVLADGSLEVRAKGAKFEIKSALTDFNAELGKRVAELVAKGTKFDSPYPVAAVAPATPAAPVAPAMPAVAAVVPKGPLTLAQRVDILFGNKPEVAAPAAVVAPTPAPAAPAVAAPVAEVAPAPSVDPKAAEKGKDLDRKLNQLFK